MSVPESNVGRMNALYPGTNKISLLSDQAVVSRVTEGETGLFEILMRRYNQRLFRIIRGYLRDDEEIRDAMQNTYLKAFDKLHQFQGNSSFSTWLIRIGINEALLRIKEMKKGRAIFLYPEEMKSLQVEDKQINTEKSMIRRESGLLLEKAIDSLPEKYRVVYILKEVEGISNEEICLMMDLSESNLRVRLHRAKAILKESLLSLTPVTDIFEFGNNRCDDLVAVVMDKILNRR